MASDVSSRRFLGYFSLAAIFFVGSGILLALTYFTYGGVLLVLGILALVKIWFLYQHTNRSIAFFFDAVRNNDTTLAFPEEIHNSTLDQLHRSLNSMNQHIQKVKLEAEIHEKYFKAIIKQSATGFIVMNKNFGVELINETACLLAGISSSSANPNILQVKNNRLFQTLCSMKAGENATFKNYNKYSVQQLLLKAAEIRSESRNLMLFSLQDIRPELSEKEIESYQKLISILTHEIMNSLAPITSISRTLNRFFSKENISKGQLDDLQVTTTIQGLKAIEEQTEGLLNFVGNYRKLIKIPPPEIKTIDVKEWIQQLYVLYNEMCREKNIRFEVTMEGKGEYIEGDKNLLNLVLINLITNAIEALDDVVDNKRILIVFSNDKEGTFIRVGNNGPIIPTELQEKIFVPFFTTKQNGSGIGLSISSQIIKLHKGTLDVFSETDIGTIFTINI
jgi:signal transduction histidine kinase